MREEEERRRRGEGGGGGGRDRGRREGGTGEGGREEYCSITMAVPNLCNKKLMKTEDPKAIHSAPRTTAWNFTSWLSGRRKYFDKLSQL